MTERKILVIDDEPRMVDSLKALLTMEGYRVIGEYDPKEAIKRLEESDFDLIITDIKMPIHDGIDILARAHAKDPFMGVILITGYASLDSARLAIDKGAFGYLTKPLEMDELKLAVAQSIEKRQIELERLKLLNELKVTNEILELRLAQINALSSAGNLLATTTDLREALTSILSLAIDVIGAKMGSVMILDPERNELYIGASCGLEDSVVQTTRMKLGSSISGYVAQAGRPLIIENIEKDARFARINRQKYESKSLISVPLIYKDQIFGVINLNNKLNGRPFTDDDLSMLVSLGLPAAVAIDRANLIAEKTRTISELTILHSLAEKVSMLDDPAKIGQATFEGLAQLLDLDFILWYDYYDRGSQLQLEYSFGHLPQDAVPLAVRSMDLPHESVTLGNDSEINNMEQMLAANIKSFVGDKDVEIIPLSIFLKRSLAGVAVLAFPSDFNFDPSLRELAILALSQTAAIYQRQRAVLNAAQLVTMGRLLADIGHDLKKPLTNLKGSIQIYRDKISGKKAREFFPEAEREVNRLSELVNEMVEFTNPNKYQTRKVNITEVLEKSLDLLKSDLKNKEVKVIKNYQQGLPSVMVNEREMYQVFVNIILNAVDSMEEGGTLGLNCETATDNGEEWIRVRFSDNGCGIPEENLNRIFDRYFTTKQTGTGLGLAIVERIVSVHNGRIDVKSDVGKGTTISIDLKL
jgi:signal transduction histidine kinase/CheY-like chemotaxis protein/putative methionine-R-sulfoxide reductase with GAF domain